MPCGIVGVAFAFGPWHLVRAHVHILAALIPVHSSVSWLRFFVPLHLCGRLYAVSWISSPLAIAAICGVKQQIKFSVFLPMSVFQIKLF